MFCKCTSLTSIADISKWKIASEEKIFCLLASDDSQYSVSIYAIDQVEYLKNTKRLMRLLQR